MTDFPCGRWLSTDEGDGKIQVELWPGKGLDEPTGKGAPPSLSLYSRFV